MREALITTNLPQAGKGTITAFIVLGDAGCTTDDLRGFLQERLPDYMIPSSFVSASLLPDPWQVGIGKHSLLTGTGPERSPNATERKLISLWQSLLGTDAISVDADFFEIGGHSLMAVHMIAEIERVFGVRLPVREVFEHSTIERLAGTIAQLANQAHPGGQEGSSLAPAAKRLTS